MLDIKKLLTKMLKWTYQPLVVNAITLPQISLTANGTYTNTSVDISSGVPSGYKALAVLPRASGSNVVYFYQCGINSGSSAVIQLRNISSAINVRPMLDVVSIKVP